MIRILLIAVLTLLFACSSNQNNGNLKEIFSLYLNKDTNDKERKLTRKIISNVNHPLILVETNGILVEALMLPQTKRKTFSNYISGSGQGLTLNGFLISKTQGLNINLISVETDNFIGLVEMTPPQSWPKKSVREYIFVTPSYGQISEKFNCENHIGEKSIIEIIEIKYTVIKVNEYCNSKKSKFVNEYWVQEEGLIRESIQNIPIKKISFNIKNLEP